MSGPATCPDCGSVDAMCWPCGDEVLLFVCRVCGKRWTDPPIGTYRRKGPGWGRRRE